MKSLHPNQQKILDLLKSHQANPLTMEELALQLDISSKSVVHYHITQLEQKGYIVRQNAASGHYFIIDNHDEPVVYLPLYGMAKCGPAGTILDGMPTRVVPVDPSMLTFPKCKGFMVEAKGDSMTDLIHPKDWLIVEKNNIPKQRDVVVCVNNGETMVKRFQPDGEQVFLVSDNKTYAPILADESLVIEGIVRSIIKKGSNF